MSMETRSAPHPDVRYGVLARKLAAVGVRPTRQRLDLARAIFGAGNRHFTAEMIFHESGRSGSRRRWARSTIRSTNFRAVASCGRLRSTTPSSGTTLSGRQGIRH